MQLPPGGHFGEMNQVTYLSHSALFWLLSGPPLTICLVFGLNLHVMNISELTAGELCHQHWHLGLVAQLQWKQTDIIQWLGANAAAVVATSWQYVLVYELVQQPQYHHWRPQANAAESLLATVCLPVCLLPLLQTKLTVRKQVAAVAVVNLRFHCRITNDDATVWAAKWKTDNMTWYHVVTAIWDEMLLCPTIKYICFCFCLQHYCISALSHTNDIECTIASSICDCSFFFADFLDIIWIMGFYNFTILPCTIVQTSNEIVTWLCNYDTYSSGLLGNNYSCVCTSKLVAFYRK